MYFFVPFAMRGHRRIYFRQNGFNQLWAKTFGIRLSPAHIIGFKFPNILIIIMLKKKSKTHQDNINFIKSYCAAHSALDRFIDKEFPSKVPMMRARVKVFVIVNIY